MGVLRYREVQWDDLNAPVKKALMSRMELIAWSVVGITLLVAIIFLLPLEDMRSTPEELLAKYPRTYAWLNRCDERCEGNINVEFLNAQQSCGGLYGLYNENKNSHLLDWRTALDDRLTALNCPGFPRHKEHILQTVSITQEEIDERQKEWKQEQQERIEYEESHQLERYRKSLKDGKLLQFVESIQELDEHTLILTVNAAWSRIAHDRRMQMNEVLWQKWATIHSLHAPMRARILLVDEEGEIVGGSFNEADHSLWVE